jgi:magnesium and cobalt exporter, CNNM family
MTLLIAFAILSIGFSFLCSILEAALLSITPSYIASLKKDSPELFARLRKLKDNIDDPLSAILTLNTIAHTVGATGVGAQVAVVFGEAWLGAASAVMTLAFIWVSKQITRRIGSSEPGVDIRAEISALAEIGLDQQAMDNDERRMIQNVLRFHEIKVSAVMTPRTVCKTVAPNITVEAFREKVKSGPFSRYPMIDEEGESLGYIHRSDLIGVSDDSDLRDVLRQVKRVKANTNIELVFAEMLRERQHLAVVYDELGIWMGIVTLEDILETLLGTEIMDETDNVSNLRRYAKQRWSRRLKKYQA